jgi:hypothetical protein
MKKYKVLLHGTQFVNENLLGKGIYTTIRPTLFEETDTIESLILKYENMRYMTKYELHCTVENLKKCRLVNVNLEINYEKI